ncbi:alpha/beta-Hydrolases superfamily protein [Rhynchospora pubera]|uniref:Alpha/beta-Hydrolases superfamily protein n=1 Tax=Rhynchospora pubera TaxID=906938 RepID=A0AAV8D3A8_9POAL|nr:alpha/beta-Hydrolases superfamily protein [Rhynchospora pubera]
MPPLLTSMATSCVSGMLPRFRIKVLVMAGGFPPFVPKEVERIKDTHAIALAKRIERVPVMIDSEKGAIMSSCVRPLHQNSNEPVVLLHGFDSSCLEWRYVYPLLEDAGVEAWAIDILGWGFSDLETLPPCDVATKRKHLYQLWKSYIKKPMVLVGPSLGAAVAIDFVANYPDAVSKLVFLDASVYAEGAGDMAKLPRFFAYAGVFVLKSLPLRLYATNLAFDKVPKGSLLDWTNVGRLHCRLPWWEDATVDFMIDGGYNVVNLIKQVKQKTLVIWGEGDRIIDKQLAIKLCNDLQDSVLHMIPECGHIPHVEKPEKVTELILSFLARENVTQEQLQKVLN